MFTSLCGREMITSLPMEGRYSVNHMLKGQFDTVENQFFFKTKPFKHDDLSEYILNKKYNKHRNDILNQRKLD